MKKHILVTGVGGLFGSNFSKYLVEKGYDVVGVDNWSGGYQDFVHKDVITRTVELTEQEEVRKIFEEFDITHVYHFAAYAALAASPFIRNFNYTNNIIPSVNLINNCIEKNIKFVFASSMDVVGCGNPPYKETDSCLPEDPYGISKYAIELDLKSAAAQFGLRYSIVRPHNVIGINQNIWDGYRNVVGIWIRRAQNDEPILVYGDGTQVRSFSDIDYYMKPLEKLMSDEFNGEIFNIGADQKISIKDLSDLFLKVVAFESDLAAKREFVSGRHEVHDAYCDHAKAKERLGFDDKTDLESLIRKMFFWATKQPNRNVKKLRYEIRKGLYDYWK